jgi:AmpE protein
MTLMAMLIGLFLERSLDTLDELRRFDWFKRYIQFIRALLSSDPTGLFTVLLAILPPVLCVTVLDFLLKDIWAGLIDFLLSVSVLVYCLGPKRLDLQVDRFLLAWERGDTEGAEWYAVEVLGPRAPTAPGNLAHAMVGGVLEQANERLLGVFFWFAVLGPAGALIYRLSCLLSRYSAAEPGTGLAEATVGVRHMLDWIPARLVALGYAVGGSFVDAIHTWRSQSGFWSGRSHQVLQSSGFGALQLDPRALSNAAPEFLPKYLREALGLVARTVVTWLVVIALMTLSGWS